MPTYDDCYICGKQEATKKNSHIIPSFLIAPIFNYDGSSKRGKEVMFTITPVEEKVYIGELPDTKIDTLFDQEKLTDERIESELRINTASRDYIFCPKCENDLSKYLESPYSSDYKNGNNTDPVTAYFFWLSVIWRISISGQFGVKLDREIEQNLGESLRNFFCAKDAGTPIDDIIGSCIFKYRLLRCNGYINNAAGYIVATFDATNKILSVIIGETIISATFCNHILPNSYNFFGSEEFMQAAPINDCSTVETTIMINKEQYGGIIKNTIKVLAKQKAETEYEIVDLCWKEVGLPGHMPFEIFKYYMELLLDEKTKLGDRMTNERRVETFNATLDNFFKK